MIRMLFKIPMLLMLLLFTTGALSRSVAIEGTKNYPFNKGLGKRLVSLDSIVVNPCAITGTYHSAGNYDSATLEIYSIDSITDTAVSDMQIQCSFTEDYTAPFLNSIISISEVRSSTENSVYSLGVTNDGFRSYYDTVYCRVRLISNDAFTSDYNTAVFIVGRPVPDNPIILSTTLLSSNDILVSWDPINPALADAIRIFYDTTQAIALNQHLSPSDFPFTPRQRAPGALSDTIKGLAYGTVYYFGAQVRKDNLWSFVETLARDVDSTSEADSSKTIVNSINISNVFLDEQTFKLGVVWDYDTSASNPDSLDYSIDLRLANDTGFKASSWAPVLNEKNPTLVDLENVSFYFDSTVYVFMRLRRKGGISSSITASSSYTYATPAFSRQPVTYFNDVNDTIRLNNNKVILYPYQVWSSGSNPDTLIGYTPPANILRGFVPVSPGFSFKSALKTQVFRIGLKIDSVPAGYTAQDVRMYKRTENGYWHVADSLYEYDSALSAVSIVSKALKEPVLLMVDTLKPVISINNDTSLVITNAQVEIENEISISDNLGNVSIDFRYARGDAYWHDSTITNLTDTNETIELTINSEEITADNGVRALLEISDGSNTVHINLSRKVVRSADLQVTEKDVWQPFFTTLTLDTTDVRYVLRSLGGVDWNYDITQFRLFRWFNHVSNNSKESRWVEFSDDFVDEFRLMPGRLMWLKTRAYNQKINFGRGVTTSLKDTFSITLAPNSGSSSWTDFIIPFKWSMYIGDVLNALESAVSDSLQFYSWEKGEENYYTSPLYVPGLAGNKLSQLDQASTGGSGLYTVYNPMDDTVELKIPPIPYKLSTIPANTLVKNQSSPDWALKLRTTSGSGCLGENILGYTRQNNGESISYYPVGPTFLRSQVSILNGKDGSIHGHVIAHYLDQGGQKFELLYRNNTERSQQFYTQLLSESVFPSDKRVVIWDGMSANMAELTKGEAVQVNLAAGKETKRIVMVGNDEYFNYNRHLIGQKELHISPPWPNPFSNIVMVKLLLPYSGISEILCSVFNAQGQLLWDEPMVENRRAGAQVYVWDGRTFKDRTISAGMYIMRIRAIDENGHSRNVKNLRLFRLP